jgi:hypothetical protein
MLYSVYTTYSNLFSVIFVEAANVKGVSCIDLSPRRLQRWVQLEERQTQATPWPFTGGTSTYPLDFSHDIMQKQDDKRGNTVKLAYTFLASTSSQLVLAKKAHSFTSSELWVKKELTVAPTTV